MPIPHARRAVAGLALLASTLLPALSGCASLPAPTSAPPAQAEGRRLLDASARAHGSEAFAQLHDINVAYSGTWSNLIKRIQPALVDDRFRSGSDERLLLAPGPALARAATGQQHDGPAGRKQVYRDEAGITVWRNGAADTDETSRAAAALVVDSYRLFLLGPLLVAPAATTVEHAGTATVDGHDCDRLLATLAPGLGFSASDQVELDVDRQSHLLRRLRFSLEGLATTRGAVVQVDVGDYVVLRGVTLPTHFVERVVRPIPGLKVHDWRVVGIDFDRGYTAADISGSMFDGAAVARAGSRGP